MPKFELILPCYNEGPTLKVLVERTVSCAIEAGFGSDEFKLILVNNASSDSTSDVLHILFSDPNLGCWLEILNLGVNRGYGGGLWEGLQRSTAPIVAYSHADLQTDPRDVFRGYKIVASSQEPLRLARGRRLGRNFSARVISRFFHLFAKGILHFDCPEINAQPKVFTREILDHKAILPPSGFEFDLYLLYKMNLMGYSSELFDVQFPDRVHGKSNWSATGPDRIYAIAKMMMFIFRLRIQTLVVVSPWRQVSSVILLILGSLIANFGALPFVPYLSSWLNISILASGMLCSATVSFLATVTSCLVSRSALIASLLVEFLLLCSIGLNFVIFVPVFLDRSLTYQMVVKVGNRTSQGVEFSQLLGEMDVRSDVEYRLEMLIDDGLIQRRGQVYFLTSKGINLDRILDFLYRYSGIQVRSQRTQRYDNYH